MPKQTLQTPQSSAVDVAKSDAFPNRAGQTKSIPNHCHPVTQKYRSAVLRVLASDDQYVFQQTLIPTPNSRGLVQQQSKVASRFVDKKHDRGSLVGTIRASLIVYWLTKIFLRPRYRNNIHSLIIKAQQNWPQHTCCRISCPFSQWKWGGRSILL